MRADGLFVFGAEMDIIFVFGAEMDIIFILWMAWDWPIYSCWLLISFDFISFRVFYQPASLALVMFFLASSSDLQLSDLSDQEWWKKSALIRLHFLLQGCSFYTLFSVDKCFDKLLMLMVIVLLLEASNWL